MERDARYAVVALFALAAIVAAAAFVWWYTGRGDHRDYESYEIYFDGSVSGLSNGSPIRYLGVDVGRVRAVSVKHRDPGRVKVLADVDTEAPVSGATRARLGLLGLTGLLYVDLQVDPLANPQAPLAKGAEYRVIPAKKGEIEAFLERMPDLVTRASGVLERLDVLLGDENVRSVGATLADLRRTAAGLPQISRDAAALAAELRGTVARTTALVDQVNGLAADAGPGIGATIGNARLAAERLATTAASLERIVASNEATLAGAAGPGVAELQQLVYDLRGATDDVAALARELRERPSSLLRAPPERGVEIEP